MAGNGCEIVLLYGLSRGWWDCNVVGSLVVVGVTDSVSGRGVGVSVAPVTVEIVSPVTTCA